MKELEMLADAIEAEDVAEESVDTTSSLDDLVAQLQNVAVQLAEAVGALKAAAETPAVEDEETPAVEDDCESGECDD